MKALKSLNLVLLLLFFPILYSQQKLQNDEIDSLIEDFFFSEKDLENLLNEVNTSLIYSSINYNSNTYYSGRSIGVNQFNLSPQLSYINSNGFSIKSSCSSKLSFMTLKV